MALLKSQGFHFNNVVDIFDAGPCLEAFIDQIDVVRTAARMSGADFLAGPPGSGLIALASVAGFAATKFDAETDRADLLRGLGGEGASEVLVYVFREKRA